MNEATRDRYGKALAELAALDRNVVAMDCDLGRSTRSYQITKVDPDRFIEMGIAEQDMISTAAGMASMGKIVFVNSFAVFVTGRCFDQIRQQVALPGLNVKICGSSAGLTQGADGATHQSVIDVAIMRALPRMIVIVPADGNQTEQAVKAAYAHQGPVYLRLSRFETPPLIPETLGFQPGKAQIIKSGHKVALAGCGPVLHNVIGAAALLAAKGIEASIINFHTLKPIDQETICQLAGSCSHVFTIEEHSIYGGLGTAVAEVLAEAPLAGNKAVLVRIGIQDTFGESGSPQELLKKHGLDPEGIARVVMRALLRSPK